MQGGSIVDQVKIYAILDMPPPTLARRLHAKLRDME